MEMILRTKIIGLIACIFLAMSCNSPDSTTISPPASGKNDSLNAGQNPEPWPTQLKVKILEGTLIYFATVARDPAEWPANRGIAVLNSGEVLMTHHSPEDQVPDGAFYSDLKHYKLLSAAEFDQLKSALDQLKIDRLPALVPTPGGYEVADGSDDYLYWHESPANERYIKIEAQAPIGNQIRDLLFNL